MSLLRQLVFAVITCFCSQLVASDDLHSDLAGAIESYVNRPGNERFSGCILLERDGKAVVRKGYGYANQAAMKTNRPDMRFDIGSVTKPIVSAAVLSQVGLGKLRLSSTLGELLPDVPEEKQAITVEQLLSHTSGMPKQYSLKNVDFAVRDQVMARLLKSKLSGPPGAQHEYSNANYFLLAAVLEIAGKQSYKEILRDSVFKPLEMRTAGFTGDPLFSDPIAGDEVSPLRYRAAGIATGTMAGWPHTWGHRGATGVLCSVDDLAAFAKALHTDRLFSEVDRQNWLRVRKSYYSLGWSVLDLPNRPRVIVHAGSASGARSILAHYPSHDVTLVVLLNTADDRARHEWAVLRAVSAALHE